MLCGPSLGATNHNTILPSFNCRPGGYPDNILKPLWIPICLCKMVFPSFLATFTRYCHKVQICNRNTEKKCMVNEILQFNFQLDIICNKCLLHSALYFVIPFFFPNPAILKCLECIWLGYFCVFCFWLSFDKTRDCLEEKI